MTMRVVGGYEEAQARAEAWADVVAELEHYDAGELRQALRVLRVLHDERTAQPVRRSR